MSKSLARLSNLVDISYFYCCYNPMKFEICPKLNQSVRKKMTSMIFDETEGSGNVIRTKKDNENSDSRDPTYFS